MASMRQFTCSACGHTFYQPYGSGVPGAEMTCPRCGSSAVHRAEEDRGYARHDGNAQGGSSGGGRGGWGSGGRGR